MTVTDEGVQVEVEAEDNTSGENQTEENEENEGKDGRARDFSKFTDKHQELADFVNANEDFVKAGIAAVTANQVKAIQALRNDWADTPEQKAAREERRKAREAEAEKYKGLTKEEIANEKAASRAENQAAKLQKRLEEALAKAAAIREGKDASGADLVAAVEAQQNGVEPEAEAEGDSEKSPRRIGRRK